MIRSLRLIAALLFASLALAGCASGGAAAPTGSADAAGGASGEAAPAEPPLRIFAAASLREVFEQLAEDFRAEHPGVELAPIAYDGSQALATQALEGAEVDVFAFASEASLKPVIEAGRSEAGEIFATNTLQIAVAPGNPKGIKDLADLADPNLRVVLCAENVPCGAASGKLLEDAGVSVTPVSEETNVSSVVQRISSGEADAGLVYTTDVKGSDGQLEGIDPANASVAVNKYPIAVSPQAPAPETARMFVEFVLSEHGQQVLRDAGFGAPTK